ncbi:YcbK family protein [Desulfosoma caldarium]|nr:DUF882 domain-containing protein [Desulfosoma caldarium]
MTRREFFKGILGAGLSSSMGLLCVNSVLAAPLIQRCSGVLSFYNLHTHERLTVRYMSQSGRLDHRALRRLDYLFRCHFTNTVRPVDRHLYLLLDAVRQRLGATGRPYLLVSGYRSPTYNEHLRRQGRGVAKKSYHMKAKAADVFIEGVSLDALGSAAADFKAGGVGTYRDFIHLDVGPVRYW